MTIRSRSILIAVVLASIGASAILFDAWRVRQGDIDEATQKVQSFGSLLGGSTTRTFERVDYILGDLAANPEALLNSGAGGPSVYQLLNRKMKNQPQLRWLSVWDAEGNLIASSQPNASAVENVAGQAWFDGAISVRGPIDTLNNVQDISGSYIPITRTLWGSDGKVRAVVMAALDSRYLAAIYSRADVGKRGNVTLITVDGTIIARFPDNDGYTGRSVASGQLFRTHLPKASSGVLRLTTLLEPHEILLSYQALAAYPLILVVASDMGELLNGWRKSLPIYGLLLVGVVVLPFGGALTFSRAADAAAALAVAQKEAEEAHVREREIGIVQRRLSNAERIANLGNWHWNIETNDLVWSDQVYRIFGLQPQEFGVSYPAFLEHVHSDDRAMVEEAVRRAVDEGVFYDIDHRIVRADGAIRTVHEQGEIARDPMGRALRMIGVVQDVTDLRKVEELARHNSALLQAAIDNMPAGIRVFDKDLRLTMWNQQVFDLFGYPEELAKTGTTYDAFVKFSFKRGDFHEDTSEETLEQKLSRAVSPSPRETEQVLPNGRIIQKRRNPMPGGGFVTTYVDVTQRAEQQKMMIAAKEEAESASRAKSEFLANMSHELRTPLNAIIGFSEMMSLQQLGPLGDARYQSYATDITASGKHLLNVINDILDVAKIEAGRMRLDETAVDLGGIAFDSIDFLKVAADKKTISTSVDVAPAMPRVLADERKIRQILINLLSNAVKFTPNHGTVTVRVAIGTDGEPVLSVSDTGIGIPEDQLHKLGQPFFQIEGALNRRFEGTGLGIALCKALTAIHNGTLTIESEVGHGTTVTIRLPSERIVDNPTP